MIVFFLNYMQFNKEYNLNSPFDYYPINHQKLLMTECQVWTYEFLTFKKKKLIEHQDFLKTGKHEKILV